MSNLDNFNTCPRCNTPNPTIAKYCFQCGAQLKSNDVPVVCSKCHTQNNGKASYCRTCGNKLIGGGVTKICPRCTNEVAANSTICDKCGFSFVATGIVTPAYHDNTPAATNTKKNWWGKKNKQEASAPATAREAKIAKVHQGKGTAKGRIYGFLLILFALAFAWLFTMPFLRVAFIADNYPFMFSSSAGNLTAIGYVQLIISTIPGQLAAYDIGDYIVLAVFVLAALCYVIELIKGLVCLIIGAQPKGANILFFIVLAIVAIGSILMNLVQHDYLAFLAMLKTSDASPFAGVTVSYLYAFGLPIGLAVLWLLGLCFKLTKKEAEILTIAR